MDHVSYSHIITQSQTKNNEKKNTATTKNKDQKSMVLSVNLVTSQHQLIYCVGVKKVCFMSSINQQPLRRDKGADMCGKTKQASWLFILMFSGLMQPLSHIIQLSETFHYAGRQQDYAVVNAPLSLKLLNWGMCLLQVILGASLRKSGPQVRNKIGPDDQFSRILYDFCSPDHSGMEDIKQFSVSNLNWRVFLSS